MPENKNVLSTKLSYLVNDLYDTIGSGKLKDSEYPNPFISDLATDKFNLNAPKNKRGIYLVNIRVLNSEYNILQYSYIYYPTLFADSLFNFLIVRNIGVSGSREPGPYLPIIENSFLLKANIMDWPSDRLDMDEINKYRSNL